MACVQPACVGAACGPTLGGWPQRDGLGGAKRTVPAEAVRPRSAGGNGICCTASSWWNKQENKQYHRVRQLCKSTFLGADSGHHWRNAALIPPPPTSHQRLHDSPTASLLASRGLVDLPRLSSSKSRRHSRFNGWSRFPPKSRFVAARAEEPDAERPSVDGASTSRTEQEELPQTSDSARGGGPNEPEERFGKGPYPNPYPIVPRVLQDWQKPKVGVIPGYEVHYHEDGRRFTEEEEEDFELQRKLGVVGAAYTEYDRVCTEAFARGDFAPIPPPRLFRLPAKVSNLTQTAQDGLTLMVPDANVYDPGISLDDALANMRAAVGYDDYYQQGIVTVTGTQELFKIEGQLTWMFEVRTGRFFEQWKSPQLSSSLGWDGNPDAALWNANMQGKVRLLELDDREVVHLGQWVRSGFYLNRSLEAKRLISLSIPNYQPEPGEFLLRIRMTKKMIKGTIVFDRETWLPKRLTMKVFGKVEERWQFNDWRRMKPGLACLHPVEVTMEHLGTPGRTVLRVQAFETRPPLTPAEEAQDLPFDVPLVPYQVATPDDPAPRQSVQWVGEDIVDVQMIRTESGHNLVRPLVDGQDIGLYLVDTGASVMTITKGHAAQLGMQEFGEVNVVTGTGEFPAPFRRGRTWQLGPLLITDPLFMEVDHLAELVTGYDPALGPVVGAVGHDLFFSATVHMRLTEAGTDDAGIQLQRPETYKAPVDDASLMQRLQMVGGCPVARGTFGRYNDLFMVDTGAAGVDLIFNKRGVAKYDLLNARRRRGNMLVKGVSPFPGQEEGAVRLFSAEVPFVLGGYTFKQPKQALLCIEENMFDLSEYVVGIICGELLEGSRIIFDYPRLRWAIIRDPIPGEEKAPYDYEFVREWESLFGHNEELAKPVGFEVNNNPVGL